MSKLLLRVLLAGILATANQFGAQQCGAGFQTAVQYGPFDGASAVVTADLNRDGKRDLIVANTEIGTVSVMLGNGNGTFQAPVSYTSGTYPHSPVVGDFNRDGMDDVAVPNSGSNNVRVFLGNGAGGLTSVGVVPVGLSPRAVRVGDFNRDGRLDLVTANVSSANVSVAFGVGDGTFGGAVSYPVASSPWSVTVADLNLDGNPDVVAPSLGVSPGVVNILYGTMTGNFLPAVALTAGNSPSDVAAGDMNGDGRPDLVVSNVGGANVSVFLATGVTSYGPRTDYGAGNGPSAVRLGDLNGDGLRDVLVTNSGGGSGGINVLYGNSNGTLQARYSYAAGVESRHPALADLNGDGRLDVAVPNAISDNVSVLLGFTGNTNLGGFPTSGPTYGTGQSPFGIVAVDLNRDGKVDLVTANVSGNSLSVLIAGTGGSFLPAMTVATIVRPLKLVTGDFNRDGSPDVAVAGLSGSVAVHMGDGIGNLVPAFQSFVTPLGTRDLAVIDVNRDGAPDLAAVNEDANSYSLLVNNGGGAFSLSSGGLPGRPQSVVAGDFNRDGIADLAVGMSGTPNLAILTGLPAGGFSTATQHFSTTVYRDLEVVDFDRDGIQDLLVANSQGTSDAYGSYLRGLGNGQFDAPVNTAAAGLPMEIVTGDFNVDGIADFLVSRSSSGITYARGLGGGTSMLDSNYPIGSDPGGMAIGDFNGDGRPDLAVARSGANNVMVLMNLAPYRPTVTLTLSTTNAASGDVVTFTATVQGPGVCEVPTGNVYFQIGATGMGEYPLNGAGVAVLSTATLPFGTNPVIAVYRGNAQFHQQTSNQMSLTLAKPVATLTLTGLSQTYDGSPKVVGVTTNPAGLSGVTVTYNGAPAPPTNAGSYLVVATLNNATYDAAPVSGTLVITKATATLTLSNLAHTYDGTAKAATVVTNPAGLGVVTVTYNGLPAAPTDAGSYAVVATLGNNNYDAAPVSGTLVIAKATATLTLGNLSQFTDGTPKQVTVTTHPAGLTGVAVTYNGAATAPVAPGSYAVVATLNNQNYAAAPVTGTLVLINPDTTAPLISAVTITPNPVAVGSAVTLSASVSDAGRGDNPIAAADYSLDGGSTWVPMTGAFLAGPATTVSASLTQPVGVYSVCVRARDTQQNQAVECGALFAVYDPTGGFVTGGGWIDSPAGAYTANPSLSGKANFGFAAKYQQGATQPSGETQFRFHVAGMQFKSSSYDWLVVAGASAKFKGSGTINGSGDFEFMLTAIDGQQNGGGGADRFRIKIWNRQTGGVVYDNQPGKDETGDDATELGGGSIIIHKN